MAFHLLRLLHSFIALALLLCLTFIGCRRGREHIIIPPDGIDHSRDTDGDGVPDAVDRCPNVADANQHDTDGDGVSDPCDPDIDGDGIANRQDLCASIADPSNLDMDGDGTGDACDLDIDGDRVRNENDSCPREAGVRRSPMGRGCPDGSPTDDDIIMPPPDEDYWRGRGSCP
jgi:hypothetical protein